jgi:hypothetical protein
LAIYRVESVVQPALLDRLAAVEGDVLGVVAYPDKGVPEIGAQTLVQEVKPHQRLTDPEREH